ncbi:MAG TPA: hypothetical protein VGL98_11325 [Gammaproteobacteria bacterium]
MRRVLLSLSLALSTVGSASAAERDPVFDGVWEGTLEVVGTDGSGQVVEWLADEADKAEARLQLRGESVRVSLDGRRLTPAMGFRIAKHDAAALVYSATVEKGYVGTWQLSLTKVDADTLLVFAWRVRSSAEGEAVAHSIAHALSGQLKRAPSRRE